MDARLQRFALSNAGRRYFLFFVGKCFVSLECFCIFLIEQKGWKFLFFCATIKKAIKNQVG
jgi:hypothetical protein